MRDSITLHKFGWTDIDRAFVSRYINYLQKYGYMTKVINKHLTNLKALINAAFIDGIHDNQRAASLIVKKKVDGRDKAAEMLSYRSRVASPLRNAIDWKK